MAAAAKGEMGSRVGDAARETYMAAYERVLLLWPQPVEALDLETTAATPGSTRPVPATVPRVTDDGDPPAYVCVRDVTGHQFHYGRCLLTVFACRGNPEKRNVGGPFPAKFRC